MQEQHCTRELAQLYLREYKRFMLLLHMYKQAVASEEIDIIWQSHVLTGSKYEKFCSAVFKEIIPYHFHKKKHIHSYLATLSLYGHVFQTPPRA
jgi:hypothetical protein